MSEHRYIVTWGNFSNMHNKTYKYQKAAFNFADKLSRCFLSCDNIKIMIEYQERKGKEWIMKDRWLY